MENFNSRRDFLKKSAALALGSIAVSAFDNNAFATTDYIKKGKILIEGKFTLPALPYGYDALEPSIDKLTMEIHHSKHHKAYVDNLNKALSTLENSALGASPTLNDIFKNVSTLPPAIRNNAGGHYNHSLFWTLMKPNGGGEPKEKLSAAITSNFGSFEEFKKQFNDAAMKRFGSGWAWLIESNGKLMISSTPNQDNPLMNLDSIEHKGKPVLAIDVWEHAYYLKHQNLRVDYITAWWQVVNWDTAEALFAA
jgi:Fe-Mn family superoxide dismutase